MRKLEGRGSGCGRRRGVAGSLRDARLSRRAATGLSRAASARGQRVIATPKPRSGDTNVLSPLCGLMESITAFRGLTSTANSRLCAMRIQTKTLARSTYRRERGLPAHTWQVLDASEPAACRSTHAAPCAKCRASPSGAIVESLHAVPKKA